MKDLIDDNPIEEDSDNDSERSRKRKKSDDEDDEDFDDRLEDEDYELLEENLGVKVQRVCYVRCNYGKRGWQRRVPRDKKGRASFRAGALARIVLEN